MAKKTIEQIQKELEETIGSICELGSGLSRIREQQNKLLTKQAELLAERLGLLLEREIRLVCLSEGLVVLEDGYKRIGAGWRLVASPFKTEELEKLVENLTFLIDVQNYLGRSGKPYTDNSYCKSNPEFISYLG
jgi:hypothetical protein